MMSQTLRAYLTFPCFDQLKNQRFGCLSSRSRAMKRNLFHTLSFFNALHKSIKLQNDALAGLNAFIAKDAYTTVMRFVPSNTITGLNMAVETTNCKNSTGCTLMIYVIDGLQAIVRFTDVINSDFPTIRAVAGQSKIIRCDA